MAKASRDAAAKIKDPLPMLAAEGGIARLRNLIRKQATGPGRITDDERVFLEKCRSALATGLRPVKPAVIRDEVEGLVAFYPTRPPSERVAERLAAFWVEDLGRLPEDVLREACAAYRRSKARQAPTPGLILEIAQPVVDARLFYSRQVDRLLTKESPRAAD